MENEILSVAIDAIKGKINGQFADAKTSDALRNAFIELNDGSTKINPKKFRPGNALFEVVQELIPVMIEEGYKADGNPIYDLVDYKNIAAGDVNEFETEGDVNFVVATAAAGIRNVRRQRLTGGETAKVTTVAKAVRVYENLGRLLAGRVDFNKFVEGVQKAFTSYMYEMAYTAIDGITASTAGLSSTYVSTGSYSEATLITMIDHVEAATGKKAKILGTRAALKKINTTWTAPSALEDLYKLGYYGTFNGTPCVALKQGHKAGTTTFTLDDNKIFIVASDDKPIKVVNAGDGILSLRDAVDNADLTNEYVYIQEIGVGVICAAPMGVYSL